MPKPKPPRIRTFGNWYAHIINSYGKDENSSNPGMLKRLGAIKSAMNAVAREQDYRRLLFNIKKAIEEGTLDAEEQKAYAKDIDHCLFHATEFREYVDRILEEEKDKYASKKRNRNAH